MSGDHFHDRFLRLQSDYDRLYVRCQKAEAERDAAFAAGMEEAARILERSPSFGDGKWAARIVRELIPVRARP